MNTIDVDDYKIVSRCLLGIDAASAMRVTKLDAKTLLFHACFFKKSTVEALVEQLVSVVSI